MGAAAERLGAGLARREAVRERQRERRVSFPDLVWARRRWDAEVREAGGAASPAAEERWHAAMAAFERRHGEIADAYWCRYEVGAVALTRPAPRGFDRLVGGHAVTIHRMTNDATRDAPDVAQALQRCQTLAVRVGAVLRGGTAHVAMQRLLFAMTELLGLVDRPEPVAAARREEAVRHALAEVAAVERLYRRAAVVAARIVFLSGMAASVVAILLLGALVAATGWGLGAHGLTGGPAREVAVWIAMGALGATVSVMARAGAARVEGVDLDFELDHRTLRRCGAYRPLVGAIFAVVLNAGVGSGIVPVEAAGDGGLEAAVVFSFLAGFSERWTTGVLGGAGAAVRGGARG